MVEETLKERVLSWWRSLERPYILFMPKELRIIQSRIESGEDPDGIPGIEKLWIWRANKRSEALAREERQFLKWVKEHPEQQPVSTWQGWRTRPQVAVE